MKKKFNLKQFIEQIDWVTIENVRGTPRLGLDDVSVSFLKAKKETNKNDVVRIRFGQNVVDQLGWDKGKTRLAIMHDPDDLLNFLIVPTEQNGRKLAIETGTHSSVLSFTWQKNLELPPMRNFIVEHYIHKNYINFRAGETADHDE